MELKSHLPIERQSRVIGVTWLDQQLIGGGKGLGDLGFGGEVKNALQQRADFLAEQELAERRWQRVILARHLLGKERNRKWRRPPRTLPPIPDWCIGQWATFSAWPASTGARSCSPAAHRDA